MLLVAPAGRGEQELRRHFDPTISWAGPHHQGISLVPDLQRRIPSSMSLLPLIPDVNLYLDDTSSS